MLFMETSGGGCETTWDANAGIAVNTIDCTALTGVKSVVTWNYTFAGDALFMQSTQLEITDADGDTSTTTLTLDFSGDDSAPAAVDGTAETADATLGSDSGSLDFDLGSDLPVTFAAVYDGGLGPADQAAKLRLVVETAEEIWG